jgi:uncharacterized protein YecE (DUF72 family)
MLPKEHKFAVEIRNQDWLVPKLADVLREHGVALTLIDQGWMPRPWEMKDKFDLITADFTYVRWLGDRKGIEELTTTWDKVIVDRQGDLSEWVQSSQQGPRAAHHDSGICQQPLRGVRSWDGRSVP